MYVYDCVHLCTTKGGHIRRDGWVVVEAAEDVDERRPPDVQLGRCQGHVGCSTIRITELLRIVSFTISAANSWDLGYSVAHSDRRA